jgi:FAD-dependent oxidoreductase domain-containing protein 1
MTTRVVIIGGGALGSLIAWFLRELGHTGEIVVIERDPSYEFSSTARSAASIRTQFGCPVNVALSLYGTDFLRAVKTKLDPEAEIDFHEGGYLILGGPDSRAARVDALAMQQSMGADVAQVAPDDLAARFPWLDHDGIAIATLGLSGEGWFDAWGLLRAARGASILRGVRFLADAATGLRVRGNRIDAVVTAAGGPVAADIVVNAAGAQSGTVAQWLGIDLPVRPRKRSVFHFKAPLDSRAMPMLFDISGAWMRPEGDGFIGGLQPEPADDGDADGDFEPHHALFEERFWPLIAARVPALQELRLLSSWAGHYDMNLFDHNGVVGPHDQITNFLFATGFSGHGVMHAPGVARGLAEHILFGIYQTIDLAPLGWQRIVDRVPMPESAIY